MADFSDTIEETRVFIRAGETHLCHRYRTRYIVKELDTIGTTFKYLVQKTSHEERRANVVCGVISFVSNLSDFISVTSNSLSIYEWII